MAGFNGFPGGGMNGNMAQIIKQAQKMQEDMKRKQQEIEEKEYEASSAGGAVKVLLSGKKEIKKIEISKDIIDPEDSETLEDSILVAVNEAYKSLFEDEQKMMGSAVGNIKLPF